jgi:hypothetical protein
LNIKPSIHDTPLATTGFDPLSERPSDAEWTGRRRKGKTPAQAIPWLWPTTRALQLKAFDDWHDVAMQIVHLAGAGFRLMAVYEKVIRWNEGCIWQSDEDLAQSAGRCSWKTISREVALHRSLGIIVVEKGWRKDGHRIVRTRTIRPAVPINLPPEVHVRDLTYSPNHTDTRGPYRKAVDTDTRGPNHTDTRGPITLDTREEGASSNVSV